MKLVLLPIFLFSLAACTSPPAPAPGATAASAANTCINPQRIQKQKVLSDTVIQFTLSNGEVWTNTMNHRCPGLLSQQSFTWDIHGNSVCSHQQTIYVHEIGTACQLGDFARVSGPAASSS